MTRQGNNIIGMGQKENRKPQAPPNLEGFTDMVCEVCGYPFFDQKVVLKRRSAIISPTGQEEIQPAGILMCGQCGWVVGQPVTEDMKEQIQKLKQEEEAIQRMMELGKAAKAKKKDEDTVEVFPPEEIKEEVPVEKKEGEEEDNTQS